MEYKRSYAKEYIAEMLKCRSINGGISQKTMPMDRMMRLKMNCQSLNDEVVKTDITSAVDNNRKVHRMGEFKLFLEESNLTIVIP